MIIVMYESSNISNNISSGPHPTSLRALRKPQQADNHDCWQHTNSTDLNREKESTPKFDSIHLSSPLPHLSRVHYQIKGVPIIPKPPIPYDRKQCCAGKSSQNTNVADTDTHFILTQYPELIRSKHLLTPLEHIPSMNHSRRSIFISPVIETETYTNRMNLDDDNNRMS